MLKASIIEPTAVLFAAGISAQEPKARFVRPGSCERYHKIEYTNWIANDPKTSNKTLSSYTKRVGIIALLLSVACMTADSIAQTAKESIDVPPGSRLLLRAVGSGDQVYGCVNGRWELKAPDAKLLNQEGSVIGRHFAGPTWELSKRPDL